MDMTTTISPKSSQLNADDLIGGARTVTITRVAACPTPEQPVAVHFDGDDGRPFLPCKSMRRVMVAVWGPDASQYVGRAMRLYRDPKVLWGGMEVGGIRISHMSHMDGPMTMALTATKQSRKPYTVKPLEAEAPPVPKWKQRMDAMLADVAAVTDGRQLMLLIDQHRQARDWFKENRAEESTAIEAAFSAAYQQHMTPESSQ